MREEKSFFFSCVLQILEKNKWRYSCKIAVSIFNFGGRRNEGGKYKIILPLKLSQRKTQTKSSTHPTAPKKNKLKNI